MPRAALAVRESSRYLRTRRYRSERSAQHFSETPPAEPATAPAPPTPPESPDPTSVPGHGGRAGIITIAGVGAGIVWLLLTADKKLKQMQGEKAYMPLVTDAAAQTNVPAPKLAGIIRAESGWSNAANSNSTKCGVNCIASSTCAIGLAQVEPSTAKMTAQALCEPANSIIAGARYFRSLYSRYLARGHSEDQAWYLAGMAYNQGPGNVDGWLKSGITSAPGTNFLPDGSRSVTDKGIKYADNVQWYAEGYSGMAGIGFLTPAAPAASMRPNLFRCAHA